MSPNLVRLGAFGVLSAALVLAFASYGVPLGHSVLLNLAWLEGADAVIRTGVFPPRHLHELWSGLGGLDFFFYGPLPTYLASAVHALCGGCGYAHAFAASAGIGFALSGLSGYLFCRQFVGPLAAFVAGTCYAILPYHLAFDWFSRQAAGEAFAYLFIPLAALGLERMRRGIGGPAVFALGVAGLGATHLPSGLLLLHVVAVVLIFAAIRPDPASVQTARLVSATVLAGALGGGLTAIIWMPALVLLGDVASSELYSDYFRASNWLIGAKVAAPDATYLRKLTLTGLLTLGIALFVLSPGVEGRRARLPWLIGLAAVPAFLMTAPSWPIWDYWILARVQFPWRLLVFVDLAAALGIATLVQRVARRSNGTALGAALIAAVLAMTILVTASLDVAGRTRSAQALMDVGAREYLPLPVFAALRARLPPGEIPSTEVAARHMARMKLEAQERSNAPSFSLQSRRALAEVAPGDTELFLPMPYWRHWRAEDGAGRPLIATPDPELGMMVLRGADGAAISGPVGLSLPWHWSEWVGLVVSAVSILGVALMFGSGRQITRHGQVRSSRTG